MRRLIEITIFILILVAFKALTTPINIILKRLKNLLIKIIRLYTILYYIKSRSK
jgi:hypothetical protein